MKRREREVCFVDQYQRAKLFGRRLVGYLEVANLRILALLSIPSIRMSDRCVRETPIHEQSSSFPASPPCFRPVYLRF